MPAAGLSFFAAGNLTPPGGGKGASRGLLEAFNGLLQRSGSFSRGRAGGQVFVCTGTGHLTKQCPNNYLLHDSFQPGVFLFRQETILILAALMTVSGVNPIIGIGVIFIVFEVNPLSIV